MFMRNFFFLFLLLALLSCEKNSPVITSTGKISSVHQQQETESPSVKQSFEADIYLVNFTSTQEAKIAKAIALIKKVILSKEFKARILNYGHDGGMGFVDNRGLSNEEIYQKIIDAAETMNGIKNNTMDVELELYHEATKTIGYTYPDTGRIWMNTKYFNRYTPVEVSDNLTHEWMHKLGFTHAMTYSPSRDHTVPYAIGYIMEELAAKISP